MCFTLIMIQKRFSSCILMLFLFSSSINFVGVVSELDKEIDNSKPTPANVVDRCQEGTVQHMLTKMVSDGGF